MRRFAAVLLIIVTIPFMMASGCQAFTSSSGTNDQRGNDLANMETARVTCGGVPFEVWLAKTPDERQKGLMFVTQDQMAPLEDGTRRGMLFSFAQDQDLSFWMKDTIIPLDIAYANSAGRIVKTYTMTPLDTSQYRSMEPARYALEVSGGAFEELGISEGDKLVIP